MKQKPWVVPVLKKNLSFFREFRLILGMGRERWKTRRKKKTKILTNSLCLFSSHSSLPSSPPFSIHTHSLRDELCCFFFCSGWEMLWGYDNGMMLNLGQKERKIHNSLLFLLYVVFSKKVKKWKNNLQLVLIWSAVLLLAHRDILTRSISSEILFMLKIHTLSSISGLNNVVKPENSFKSDSRRRIQIFFGSQTQKIKSQRWKAISQVSFDCFMNSTGVSVSGSRASSSHGLYCVWFGPPLLSLFFSQLQTRAAELYYT